MMALCGFHQDFMRLSHASKVCGAPWNSGICAMPLRSVWTAKIILVATSTSDQNGEMGYGELRPAPETAVGFLRAADALEASSRHIAMVVSRHPSHQAKGRNRN
jgi:hypothetical protein